MSDNRNQINHLRKENKTIAAKLKMLKKPTAGQRPSGPAHLAQEEIQAAVKKRNLLRHQVKQKEERYAEVEKKLKELALEERHASKTKGGASTEMQRLRALENSLDKANIKAQEAQHIKRTYEQIISQLEKDRLQFDGTIATLEKAVEARKQELVQLESMCTDACMARDQARQTLVQREETLATERKTREEEKARMTQMADERRRQYEAMEKRLRMASAGTPAPKGGGCAANASC